MRRARLLVGTSLSGALVSLCFGCTGYVIDPRPRVTPGTTTSTVLCHVTRDECAEEFFDTATNTFRCRTFESTLVDAHACYDGRGQVFPAVGEQACFAKYCSSLSTYNNNCRVTSVEAAPQFPAVACARTGGPDSMTTPDAVSCELRGRECVSTLDPSGQTVCDPLRSTIQSLSTCFNPVTTSAFDACEGADQLLVAGAKVLLTGVVPNGCAPMPAPAPTDLKYSLPAAPVAQTSFLGQTLNLNQHGGFARVRQNCSEGCFPTSLTGLRILGDNFVANGTPVRNPEIRLAKPATILGDIIEEGDLELQILTTVGSSEAPATFTFRNSRAVSVTATPTSFNLRGTVSLVTKGPVGQAMAVSFGLSSSGTPAPALNCDTLTPKQQRFGFEDAGLWFSTQAGLSTIASPRTEGCFALGVTGSGYMVIESSPFPSSDAGHVSKLSVDLFIPANQPNRFWLGALQSYLECPSANVFNAYIGQVELTGRPTGRFSTLTYNLPQNVRNTLGGNWNDCSVKFALNVNQTGQMWVLDRMRFTN